MPASRRADGLTAWVDVYPARHGHPTAAPALAHERDPRGRPAACARLAQAAAHSGRRPPAGGRRPPAAGSRWARTVIAVTRTSPPSSDRPSLGFRLIAWLAIAFVWLTRWRVRTEGLEHVPARGGAVITFSHTSHVDFAVTGLDIYRRLGRPVHILARADLWQRRRFRWIVRLASAVPVQRENPAGRAASLQAAVEVLRGGGLVFVAPESRISTTFEVQSMRTGAARMAQQAGVPLVPSASWGSHRLVTTGHPTDVRRAWAIPIEVAFAPPVEVADDDDVVAVTAELETITQRLLHRLQRRYPDGAPAGAWWVPARLGGGAPPP